MVIEHLAESGKETLGEVTVPASGSLWVSAQIVPNFIQLEPKKFTDYLNEERLTADWESSWASLTFQVGGN